MAAARALATDFGCTGYATLPPGIAKNLAKGKPLPPGIAQKAIPANLLGKLPVHQGYTWQSVGQDLILLHIASGIVFEVLRGVFR